MQHFDLHQIDPKTDHELQSAFLDLNQELGDEKDSRPKHSKEQNGAVESDEIHVVGSEEVTRETVDAFGLSGHGVEIGDEVEVGVGASEKEVKCVFADGEGGVKQQSEQLHHSQQFHVTVVDPFDLQGEEQHRYGHEGHHYYLRQAFRREKEVLFHELGVLPNVVHVCVVTVNYVLGPSDGLHEYDLEGFAIIQIGRHLCDEYDSVVDVLKVSDGQIGVGEVSGDSLDAFYHLILVQNLSIKVTSFDDGLVARCIQSVLGENLKFDEFAMAKDVD